MSKGPEIIRQLWGQRMRLSLPTIFTVLVATGLMAGNLATLLQGQSPQAAGAAGPTEVVLLGTGTPYPDPQRQGPATAVVVGERVFLFDAGAGVMRQMRGAALPINGVEAFFVTHLHSDHTLGYPDLILTTWVMRRRTALQAYGPPGLERMTDHLLAAWEEDIRVRIEGLEREPRKGYRVEVHEIGPGIAYDSAGVRVTAFPVYHGNWATAYGYRLDAPDRSIVISGDARPSEALVEAARGVDLLVHETYPAERVAPEDRPGGELWPQYMREFHTSALELGRIAAASQPKLLLLTHIVWMGGTGEEIVAAIREGGYTGPVVIGQDLGRY